LEGTVDRDCTDLPNKASVLLISWIRMGRTYHLLSLARRDSVVRAGRKVESYRMGSW
jgi:hypothetical protein